MSAIHDDDEDVLAGITGERTVVVNTRELALQAIEDGRIHEFEQETSVKVPTQSVVDEDMGADDVAAEQERARLQAVADVMRTHQKTAAADQRLEEATRLLREAEARTRAVPEVAAPAATPPKDEAADIAAELTTALFAGDEDKARELLRQGLSRPSIPTPAPVLSVEVLGGRWNSKSRSKVH